ncbi:Hypothetical predicted protein [Octopus vulgaris]|uniref:Osteopetrosis-associated transmembrane protein 1 n=1 Tax=Octopus vulgaris TaxID=6645 RepID=A0AA36ALP6_OCTVU|nr:Hypothetical predicted protein [Octopus vulgaris]
MDNINPQCKSIECTGQIQNSFIERARPYRFCTECLQDYKAAIDLYSDIASASKNSTLVICKNLLMKSDYAPLIPSVFQDIETLWSSAYCSSCYSVTEDKVELNNKTVKFIDSYKEMIACFENNTLNQATTTPCRTIQTVCTDPLVIFQV